jgi:hypothetical protein
MFINTYLLHHILMTKKTDISQNSSQRILYPQAVTNPLNSTKKYAIHTAPVQSPTGFFRSFNPLSIIDTLQQHMRVMRAGNYYSSDLSDVSSMPISVKYDSAFTQTAGDFALYPFHSTIYCLSDSQTQKVCANLVVQYGSYKSRTQQFVPAGAYEAFKLSITPAVRFEKSHFSQVQGERTSVCDFPAKSRLKYIALFDDDLQPSSRPSHVLFDMYKRSWGISRQVSLDGSLVLGLFAKEFSQVHPQQRPLNAHANTAESVRVYH